MHGRAELASALGRGKGSAMTYHIARGDEKLGEFNDLDISAGLRDGTFQPTDLCWAANMTEWEPLSNQFQPPEPKPSVADKAASSTEEVYWSTTARPGDLELATRMQRVLAWLVDWITLLPALVMLSQALHFEEFALKHQDSPRDQLPVEFQRHIEKVVAENPDSVLVSDLILMGIFLVNMVLLIRRGQTFGKWLIGIRIVKFQSGQKPGFVSVILLRTLVMGILTCLPYVGLGLYIVDLFGIFRHDRRCLHDMIADTMVIKSR